MYVSPPSGRAASRVPLHRCLGFRARATALLLIAAAFMLVVQAIAAPGAEAKKKKDRRAPYVVKSITVDTDGNGKVDGVMLTYSEKVKIAKIRKGKGKAKKKNRKKIPWRTGSHKFVSAKVLSGRKKVLVRFSEGDAVDTGERPKITYVRVPKGARGVVDRAGNQALRASVNPSDALPPVLISAQTADADADGGIDRMAFFFSEPVMAPAFDRLTVAGYAVTGAEADGARVDAALAEQGSDTQATPIVAAAAGAVEDLAGNTQATDGSVTSTDGAAPAVLDAATADADANGRLDTVVVRFSELITHVAETGAATAVRATGLTVSGVSAATGDSVDVTLSDSVGGYNTNLKPQVTLHATASPVADVAGNVATGSTFSATRDAAPPALVSAKTRDADRDGYVDGVAATFSEPVSHQTFPGAAFSSTASELGVFSGAASVTGAIVTATVTENMTAYNTDLPRVSPSVPVPVTYTDPGGGDGVKDAAALPAADKTVQATDGAGPAIVYAETVDDNPADGHIDGMKIGFSEPIATLVGNPFTIADGVRIITTDGTQKIVGGSPGDDLYGGVSVPLYPLTTDGTFNGPLADPDGSDKPTVDYQTVINNNVATDYAQDASGNKVTATDYQAFTATTDTVKPVVVGMSVLDGSLNGMVDVLRTVWSEPVLTDGSTPFAALSPQNAPLSGYSPPAITTPATVASYALTTPLIEATGADRDTRFTSQYMPSGPGDASVTDVSGNNAATSPASPISAAALCVDAHESSSGGQDDSAASAHLTGLSAVNGNHLATLCGNDWDYYKFSMTGTPATAKVLVAPAPHALAARASDNDDMTFNVTGPSGAIVPTVAFDPGVGWIATFAAASDGEYVVGVRDSEPLLLDYGYCVSRTDDGTDPSCSVRQGDMIITEVLRDVDADPPELGPYVEIKNVSGAPVDIDGSIELVTGGSPCTVQAYSGTTATIAAGATFYVSNTPDSSKTNDFFCSGMNIQYSAPIAVQTTVGGTIDSVDMSSVSPPEAYSVQLRATAAWETSSANDNVAAGWCLSKVVYGSWGETNNSCDEFFVNEVGFLPTDATNRDGRVYVEIKGAGALTPTSALLGNWRLRIKPKGLPGAFFVLPANANPNTSGVYLVADSPATGVTQVPLYSVESAGLTAGDTATGGPVSGRTLNDYLRADRPVTVKLVKPAAGDLLVCDMAALDTLGFSPTAVGTLVTPDDDDGVCGSPFTGAPFPFPVGGFDTGHVVQRDSGRAFQDSNQYDFCAHYGTPLRVNEDCFGAT